MKKLHHIVSILLGVVFVLSGVGKALNVWAFQQLIHSYGYPYLDLLAPIIILAELILGALLIVRERVKTMSLLSGILLLLFTGVYTYGYARQGITDCGCFGAAQVVEWPAWAVYVRNIVLLVFANYLYLSATDEPTQWTRTKRIIMGIYLAIGIFLTGMTYRPAAFWPHAEHPLTGQAVQQTPLAGYVPHRESVWVLCYSYSCSHCLNTMENYLAMQRYERVDTILSIAVLTPGADQDSLRQHFGKMYPQVVGTELLKTDLSEIEQFPTSLLIEDDTIRQVWVGEMPNPYLIETKKSKNQLQ